MKFIPSAITNKFGHQLLVAEKHSPRLLFVAGIIGAVGSTILACRATLKLEETLETFTNDIEQVKGFKDLEEDIQPSKVNYGKDMAYVYAKGTMSLVKLYAPAVILGSVSIGALTTSHVTLSHRNAGLMAAYSGLSTSFDAYRDRVRAELGEDKERDIHDGAVYEKAEIEGKIQTLRVLDPNKISLYSRLFDQMNANWQKNPEINRVFLQAQQNYMNNLLHARGHVFLNEVYVALGMEHSSAGAVVGWVLGQGGDNYIDFGIFDPRNAEFQNGWERSVLLDFNVDGVIFDKI